MEFQLSYLPVYRPNLFKITSKQWKVVIPWFVPWGHEFDFYLAIERIPIGLAVTLEFIGPLLVAVFGSKRFVDYLWVLLAAAGIVLIAWTNNGINVLGVLFALLAGAFGLLSSWEERFQNNERRRLLQECSLLPY
jgi:inner membrane transporter RhtA